MAHSIAGTGAWFVTAWNLPLSPMHKLVLIGVVNATGGTGEAAHESIEGIAKYAGISTERAAAAVDELTEWGWLG